MRLALRFTLAAGFAALALPALAQTAAPINTTRLPVKDVDFSFEGPFGTYRRTVKQVAPGQIKMTTRSTLVTGTYEAGRYPEIVDYTRKIKAAEDQVIRAK